MLGKQKMTRLTPPRIGLVKMSSTMLYRAKKREIRGRRPSVKIESMVERYLPLLAPVLSRISSPLKFAVMYAANSKMIEIRNFYLVNNLMLVNFFSVNKFIYRIVRNLLIVNFI